MYPWQIIWRDIKSFFHRRRLVVMHEETVRSIRELAENKRVRTDEFLDWLVDDARRGREMDTYAMQCWRILSDRERRITALICAGLSTDQIAERTGIARSTVKTHIKKIFVKFQVHDRKTLREILSNYDLREFE